MKKIFTILIFGLVSFALSLPLASFATPPFPMNFYGISGEVTIDGDNAPIDSVIKVWGNLVGDSTSDDVLLAQFTLTSAGIYGDSDRTRPESEKLSVPEYTGNIEFRINSPSYNSNAQSSDWSTPSVESYGSFSEFANINKTLAFTGATVTAVQSIAVTPTSASIVVGATQQFICTGTYIDATTTDMTSSCEWTSSSTGVATIGINSGLATGVAAGSTTITASYTDAIYGDLTHTASLTVTSAGGGGGGGTTTPAMPSTTTGEVTATRASGGTTTFTATASNKVTVKVPAYAVSASTKIAVSEIAATASAATTAVSAVLSDKSIVGGYVYDITAVRNDVAITSFDKDITITLTYTDAQITGLKRSSLAINYWDEDDSEWNALATTVYKRSNKLVAKTDHFTYFAIIGEEGEDEEEPMTIAELKAAIADILAQIKVLRAELAKLIGVSVEGCAITSFDRSLKLGMTGDDVECMQIILNSADDTRVANTGVGSAGNETNYFGSLTKAAVIKFQEKYASDILAPWDLTEGTGYAGSTTIDKLNSLLK